MPRRARRKSCNGIYHIMMRGVNKQTIFEDDQDRFRLLDTISKYKNICNFDLYSYCLMDNHVHLLIKETEVSVSKFMQRINGSYVFWYNNKYDRCGHLFQDRFRSESVETAASFLTVLRYIHQNPVKAGLTSNVFDYRWTSMNEYLGRSKLVNVDLGLKLFDADRRKAIPLFAEHMQTIRNDDECFVNRISLSDSEVREHLISLGIPNSSYLQQVEKKKRNAILLELKNIRGVTIRQLSRVTGISKSVIDRIR